MSASPSSQRVIDISCSHQRLQFEADEIVSLFEYLDAFADDKLEAGELSIALLNEKEICRLHADFMEDPTPTDVITFQGEEEEDFAGEICVCVDVAEKVSLSGELPFSEEMTLYLIHGWLHLAGYRDKKPEDIKAMRDAESRTMNLIKKSEKMPTFKITESPL